MQGNPRLTVFGLSFRQPASNSSTRTAVGRAFACRKSEEADLGTGELARRMPFDAALNLVQRHPAGSFSFG